MTNIRDEYDWEHVRVTPIDRGSVTNTNAKRLTSREHLAECKAECAREAMGEIKLTSY